jgi:murein L,D-transpeptidase YcbB/YkuD
LTPKTFSDASTRILLLALCITLLSSPGGAAAREGDGMAPLIRDALATRAATDGIEAFYADRAFEPVWFREGRPLPEAKEVAIRIALAGMQGLEPGDYLSGLYAGEGPPASLDETAAAEVDLTETLLRYAADLHHGRFRPASVDRKWHIRKPRLDVTTWLSDAVQARDIGRRLDALAPPHPVYRDLRRSLEEYLSIAAAGGWPAFPRSGPRKLEPGDQHEQVSMLRSRLAVTDGAAAEALDPQRYDPDLVEAVKRFQRRHGLNEDGVVGRRTRAALAVPVGRRILQLRAALERWRWMPADLGTSYVLVNVPAYRLWFYEDGEPTLTMRTIVGKYKRQTPTFAASISYFVMRPKWYVPRRIAVQDLLPKAQDDPEYYRKGGYTVFDRETGETVDPATVDWTAYGDGGEFPFRLVQGAGDSNALGDIKFMFENPYGVYLHDTSSPRLFLKDHRTFSSGCIRVEKPLELAAGILSEDQPTTPETVSAMISRAPKNRYLTLRREVPLYVVYVSAWADAEQAYFYDDPYRRDNTLLEQLQN